MHTTDARLHKPRAMEQSPRQSQDMSSLHVVGIASSSINFGTKCPLSTCQPHVSKKEGLVLQCQHNTKPMPGTMLAGYEGSWHCLLVAGLTDHPSRETTEPGEKLSTDAALAI